MKKIFLFLAMVLFFAQIGFAQVTTGELAKDFTLKDTKGVEHHLTDYKGKFVVLEWLNHDCPFVKKYYSSGNMQALQKEYIAKGVVWLSINSSAVGKEGYYSPEDTDKLTLSKNAAPTAVLLDSDGIVGNHYGAQTTPHMYIIDPNGILIYQGAIDDKPSTDPGDIQGAKNYVRAALDEGLAGKEVTDSTTKSYGCSVKY